MDVVTVYSKPACVQCNATYRALENQGIAYRTVDLSRDPDALERVRALGHMQAPVVIAGNEHWSGFRPDKIEDLAGTGVIPGQLDALDLLTPQPD